MKIIEVHVASKQKTPIRFQEYGVGIFNSVSTKSAIKKAIKKELVCIDGVVATTSKYIAGGEKIELYQSEQPTSFKRLKLKLEVLFEDKYLAAIYKPPGILVSGNKFVTITNALPQNLAKSNLPDAVNPQPIHRLDYPTSGVLLIGKTSSAIQELGKLFQNKEIQKTYCSITIGAMPTRGEIRFPIDQKEAFTTYKVLQIVKSERFGFLNLVKLAPKTGRKHQLRKHLCALGNPILGDQHYFLENKILKGKGLYLHAYKISFLHPITKENTVIVKELPEKFKRIFTEISNL
ncbi:RluA family pseudouridine synthase [Polaribacter litorisediminis]|uniref:RluA family pseudouridine synthase n=1 Tax=Polaribacter litorisediminis TaxID=1908341 RepID=UPI001CBF62B0|nr:RluA family pseudouridine synthase [Polaribacter litorisediminis]UAM96661.1 RluA family pseudouridine synthase [Polaribacter litorisediminis]